MRALIYCRVSRKEQVQRYSLADQEADCRELGLLKPVPAAPPDSLRGGPLHVQKDVFGYLAYFGRATPSDPLTVQAIEMRQGWKRPHLLYVSGSGEQAFDIIARKRLEAVE